MSQRTEAGESVARSYGRSDAGGEQPIELRRHLDAIRRGRWLIAFLVLGITGTTLALSLVLPKSYRATTRIVLQMTTSPLIAPSSDTIQRSLATTEALIKTHSVLAAAVRRLPGETEQTLRKKISTSVDQNANIIDISASDKKPARAAAVANTVAKTFLDVEAATEQQQLQRAEAQLKSEIARLGSVPGSKPQIAALQTQLSDLTVAAAGTGSELQIAQPAEAPVSPTSPLPGRNTAVAFFASLFLGILVALGRDQLVPRVGGPRELSRITDLPVLVGIPFVRRRFGQNPTILSGVEHEAYQTLQASIRFQLPPTEQHILLVSSAIEGEGKTTVTANLGRALARAGQKTLLVSADMRRPKLHEHFDLESSPGLSEVLVALGRGGSNAVAETIAAVNEHGHAPGGARGNLHVLPSGKRPADPAPLLLSDALRGFFDELKRMEYSYVLLDAPPLLGIADSQVLAQRADDMLLVVRLERETMDSVVELRDLVDRLDVTPLGMVVVGVRRGVSYYYGGAPELEDA